MRKLIVSVLAAAGLLAAAFSSHVAAAPVPTVCCTADVAVVGTLEAGETVEVIVSGMPKGKNYVTVAIYDLGLQYAERKTVNGDGSLEFTLPVSGLMYVWADDNASLTDGFVGSASFDVQP